MGFIQEQMAAVTLGEAPAPPLLKAGALCLARFSLDGQWYRARVERANTADPVNPQYDVAFIDYGNKEHVTGAAVRAITPALEAVPPQAQAATLAYVKACSL